MAARITNKDIVCINELYYKHKTYAEVARQTGFSASTVKKYVIPNWQPVEQKNIIRFEWEDIPDFDGGKIFEGVSNYGYLCSLTDYERREIEELWKELST